MHPLRAALLLACMAPSAVAAAAPQFRPDLATLPAVPRVELPADAVRKALAEPVKSQPYQYAVPVELDLAPAQGRWATLGTQRSWRLRLRSPGALSLGLQLEQPFLPDGATLWVYDPAAGLTHGPFDADQLGPSGLWTPPVAGEELVVEVRAPAGDASRMTLGKARAFHGFRDWKAETVPAKAGSCNVDISCPQALSWLADAGSVARISIGNTYLCTGQLLNNVRQDKRRLFITAHHCGVGETSGGPPESVVFYFNYVGPCGDGVTQPVPAPTFQGSQRLAHDVQSDFTLLLITDPAPLPAGTYFAGWDATGVAAGSGATIHHPSGEEKKIAFFGTVLRRDTVDVGTGCRVAAWEVQWDSGTTEAGSSGGGLWDASHRLVGVLSGGFASCANPTGRDYYARFDRAWTAGASAERQLKAHLDPDGTCVAIVPGLDALAAAPGAVAPTPTNQLGQGTGSTCGRQVRSGGPLDAPALALLLAGVLRRRLQHHQQHARNRHR